MRTRALLFSTLPALLLLSVSVSACGGTKGIDGVLTDEWPAIGEPVAWTPPQQGCRASFSTILSRFTFDGVDCAQAHRMEIVHVGQFPDSPGLTKPPTVGQPEFTAAWAECDAKVTAFLGGPWRDRKIWISVSVPSAVSWSSGARWFACEAAVITQMKGSPTSVSYSLKGKFAAEPALAYGCLQVDKEGKWSSKACTEPHNSEFAGSLAWGTSYEDLNKEIARDDNAVHRKCMEVIAGFVGTRVRTGTYVWIPTESDWNAGDKTIRCFFWLGEDKSVTRSMKGAGASGWPLR
jgi:Septum formation